MFKINIIRNQIITNSSIFKNLDLANEWLNTEISNGSFGKPEHTIVVEDAVYDEEGVLLQEEVTQLVPAEFTIEIEDITEEVNQKKINQEAELFLKETDWMVVRFVDSGIAIPEDIKEQRALARARIVR